MKNQSKEKASERTHRDSSSAFDDELTGNVSTKNRT